MEDKHEEVDGGVSEEEHGRYPRAASLDKIVDFCAEEFGKKCVYLSCFQSDWQLFLLVSFSVFFAQPTVFWQFAWKELLWLLVVPT